MNPVFWFLVILFLIIIWFDISPSFIKIGGKISDKLNETVEILNKEENNTKEDEKEI